MGSDMITFRLGGSQHRSVRMMGFSQAKSVTKSAAADDTIRRLLKMLKSEKASYPGSGMYGSGDYNSLLSGSSDYSGYYSSDSSGYYSGDTYQWTCSNGSQIPLYWVCDQWDDCGDMSDESQAYTGNSSCTDTAVNGSGSGSGTGTWDSWSSSGYSSDYWGGSGSGALGDEGYVCIPSWVIEEVGSMLANNAQWQTSLGSGGSSWPWGSGSDSWGSGSDSWGTWGSGSDSWGPWGSGSDSWGTW